MQALLAPVNQPRLASPCPLLPARSPPLQPPAKKVPGHLAADVGVRHSVDLPSPNLHKSPGAARERGAAGAEGLDGGSRLSLDMNRVPMSNLEVVCRICEKKVPAGQVREHTVVCGAIEATVGEGDTDMQLTRLGNGIEDGRQDTGVASRLSA